MPTFGNRTSFNATARGPARLRDSGDKFETLPKLNRLDAQINNRDANDGQHIACLKTGPLGTRLSPHRPVGATAATASRGLGVREAVAYARLEWLRHNRAQPYININ
jgi:hypothetical protein